MKKGQLLATILDIFGGEQTQLIAPRRGIVLGLSTLPVARPGDAIFHIGIAPKTLVHDHDAEQTSPSAPGLIRRIQRELATNITVSKPGS